MGCRYQHVLREKDVTIYAQGRRLRRHPLLFFLGLVLLAALQHDWLPTKLGFRVEDNVRNSPKHGGVQPLLTKPVVGSYLFHLIRYRVHPTGEVILGQNAPLIELIRECRPNQSIEIVKVPQSSVYLIDQLLGCVVVRHAG